VLASQLGKETAGEGNACWRAPSPPTPLPGGEGRTVLSAPWLTYASVYAAMGVATLVKGPIGVVLPTGVLGLFLLWQQAASDHDDGRGTAWRGAARFALRAFAPTRFLGTLWAMRPLTALAAVLLTAGPWFTAVGIKTRGEFLRSFFGVHHFHRFTSPMDN